jgi:hypothetical protein
MGMDSQPSMPTKHPSDGSTAALGCATTVAALDAFRDFAPGTSHLSLPNLHLTRPDHTQPHPHTNYNKMQLFNRRATVATQATKGKKAAVSKPASGKASRGWFGGDGG